MALTEAEIRAWWVRRSEKETRKPCSPRFMRQKTKHVFYWSVSPEQLSPDDRALVEREWGRLAAQRHENIYSLKIKEMCLVHVKSVLQVWLDDYWTEATEHAGRRLKKTGFSFSLRVWGVGLWGSWDTYPGGRNHEQDWCPGCSHGWYPCCSPDLR